MFESSLSFRIKGKVKVNNRFIARLMRFYWNPKGQRYEWIKHNHRWFGDNDTSFSLHDVHLGNKTIAVVKPRKAKGQRYQRKRFAAGTTAREQVKR